MFLVLLINLVLVPGGSSAGPSAVQQGPAPVAAPQSVPTPQTSAPVVPQTTAPAPAPAPAQ
jgi:hypothetical protein